MFTQTVTMDQKGRITLPQPVIEALGADQETELVIELTEAGATLKPKQFTTPITERIAAMNLPVADWEQMEREIEAGRLM